jgi:hypothetical protein
MLSGQKSTNETVIANFIFLWSVIENQKSPHGNKTVIIPFSFHSAGKSGESSSFMSVRSCLLFQQQKDLHASGRGFSEDQRVGRMRIVCPLCVP